MSSSALTAKRPTTTSLWHKARQREDETVREARQIIRRLGISMKLSDVEYQGDNARATFYYTAEQRDFRDLVRSWPAPSMCESTCVKSALARSRPHRRHWRVGRELCCVLAQGFPLGEHRAARYQQLSLNPGKLAGQCGKLEVLLELRIGPVRGGGERVSFPQRQNPDPQRQGGGVQMDIFQRLVYFLQLGEPGSSPIAMNVEDAKELIAASEKGEVVGSLASYEIEEEVDEVDSTFGNVVGQESLAFRRSQAQAPRNKRKPGQVRRPIFCDQGNAQGSKDDAGKKPSRNRTEIGTANRSPWPRRGGEGQQAKGTLVTFRTAWWRSR